MSEYQYYEFQTVERSLTEKEREVISQLSSRVQLSSTRAIFTYSYGDFRGEPEDLLAQSFDAMFYIANWGTIQLMFRFPKSLLNLDLLKSYCLEDSVEIIEKENYIILNLRYQDEDGFGWIEGDGYLDKFIRFRQDILEEDYRCLYITWLKMIDCHVDVQDHDEEPPVPQGLKNLSTALNAWIELLEIDSYLVQVAAMNSEAKTDVSLDSLETAITQLSRSECEDYLRRLLREEPSLAIDLKQQLSQDLKTSHSTKVKRRTVKELLESAEEARQKQELKEQQEAEAQRIKALEAFAKQESQAWQTVDTFIQQKQSKPYDEAAKLLARLEELAIYQGNETQFYNRIKQMRQQYSNRPGLLRRLKRFI
jgi:hypothetical protein